MQSLFFLGIHIVAGKVIIELLAVILLLLLNMGKGVAQDRADKLEYTGVIYAGHVLFHRKCILTEIGIVLLLDLITARGCALQLCLHSRGGCRRHRYLAAA